MPTARPFPRVDGLPSREPSKDGDPTENKSELATAVGRAVFRVQQSRGGPRALRRPPPSSALLEGLPGGK